MSLSESSGGKSCKVLAWQAKGESSEAIELTSHFQPIFILAHRRIVGYEALLRGANLAGNIKLPSDVFAMCHSVEETVELDSMVCNRHAANFAGCRQPAQWLFLNVDTTIFSGKNTSSAFERLKMVCQESGLAPHQIVVEILESAIDSNVDLELQVKELKAEGFLIALDDFSAGHSNFDRVFRLAPTLVKLDRSVVAKAALDQTVRRATTQMVSLLQECGAFILMEGVERQEEAIIALDSDTDFVQGYFFWRPSSQLLPAEYVCSAVEDTWKMAVAF